MRPAAKPRSHARAWMLAAALLVSAFGCRTVDRMEIFQPDYESAVPPRREVDVPEDRVARSSIESEPQVPAEGAIPLSIEQAVMLGLRNDRELRVAQLESVVTGAFEAIERGVYDPELYVDAEVTEDRSSETDRATGERFDVKGEEARVEAGIRQVLPTGTEIEGNVSQRRSISDRAPELQEARLGLTVTQSLLEGLGPAVNLASVRQAELETEASRHELRGFTESVVAQIEIAYWNHVLARREIEIFERSLEVADRQRDEVEQRIEVGVLADTEAAAARAEVALREQALIDARSEVEQTRLRLVRRVDPDAAGRFERELDLTTLPEVDAAPIDDLEDRLKLAEERRPDLAEARTLLRRDELDTLVTRNGLLPRLDVFLALGRTGFGDTFDESFRELETNTYDWTAGVSFSYLLGNRAARARDHAAQADRRRAEEAVENLLQLVRLDVRIALDELERTRQQIGATAATRALQEQTVEAEQARFEVGSSTALLVAQAQRDLLQAQIAEVESVVAYRIARVRLFLAEGSLLERRGIRFD